MANEDHAKFMQMAYEEAEDSYKEGGAAIGAVMVHEGKVISRGRNRKFQNQDPTSHGETDCIRNAGIRPNYKGVTLYTTMSPCMMCAGTMIQLGIRSCVVGENETFSGNEDFLRERGIDVIVLHDMKCKVLLDKYISETPTWGGGGPAKV